MCAMASDGTMTEPVPSAGDAIAAINRAVEADGDVDVYTLVRIAAWQRSEDPHLSGAAKSSYPSVFSAFMRVHPKAMVSVHPALRGGVLLDGPGPRLTITMSGEELGFDWSAGAQILDDIQIVEDDTHVWLSDYEDRLAIIKRLYGLTTRVLTALSEAVTFPGTRDGFAKRMETPAAQLKQIQVELDLAARRSAQAKYVRGMAFGMAILAALAGAVGLVFLWQDVRFANEIALVAGGLGAVVSVMQRMSSGKLKLDYRAAGKMLKTFGAVRPLLGGIFGMVVFAIIEGGFLPWIKVPSGLGAYAAFFAVLGFLSGFNERFAQDMLGRATQSLDPPPPPAGA